MIDEKTVRLFIRFLKHDFWEKMDNDLQIWFKRHKKYGRTEYN